MKSQDIAKNSSNRISLGIAKDTTETNVWKFFQITVGNKIRINALIPQIMDISVVLCNSAYLASILQSGIKIRQSEINETQPKFLKTTT